TPIRERGNVVASINDLLVFFGRPRPDNELNEPQLTESLIEASKKQLDEAQPRDAASLDRFREQFGEAFRYSLMAEFPDPNSLIVREEKATKVKGKTIRNIIISRRGKSDRVSITWYDPPSREPAAPILLLVAPDNAATETTNLIESLNRAGHGVILVHCFPGGRQIPEKIKFFTTYNRTDTANRAQDILTAIAYLKRQTARVSVIGLGEAGLWALLARGIAPALDRMVIDAAQF